MSGAARRPRVRFGLLPWKLAGLYVRHSPSQSQVIKYESGPRFCSWTFLPYCPGATDKLIARRALPSNPKHHRKKKQAHETRRNPEHTSAEPKSDPTVLSVMEVKEAQRLAVIPETPAPLLKLLACWTRSANGANSLKKSRVLHSNHNNDNHDYWSPQCRKAMHPWASCDHMTPESSEKHDNKRKMLIIILSALFVMKNSFIWKTTKKRFSKSKFMLCHKALRYHVQKSCLSANFCHADTLLIWATVG